MRRLILMRHAKSNWSEPDQRDRDRPLNKRGRRSAGLIGAWLAQKGYRPDHALVSNARRTQETWSGIVEAAGPAPTDYLADLYLGAPDVLLRCLRAAPDVGCVLMLGHQPGIGEFARRLLVTLPDDAAFGKYPTGATTVIDFAVENWPEVGPGAGRLVDFVVPRTLE